MANKRDLARALAGDKNLRDADLSNARLGGANLNNADLRGATLADADLTQANLDDAALLEADLSGADLTLARLRTAGLFEAYLDGAKLRGANLRGSDLTGADLTGADLTGANLSRAYLTRANLTDANLSDASLPGADLIGANLTGANLRGAGLADANLTRANLTRANLTDADLSDANLTRANLSSANLTGADLTDADLSDADLSDADLIGARLTRAVGYSPSARSERRRTSGRATGAVLKLGAADVPVDPRDFKRRFPREFDLLARRGLAGRPFRPEAVAAIQKQLASPVEWVVTRSKYRYDAQRYCSVANEVLLLNIDLSDSSLTERQREALRKLAEVSRRSGHPHEKGELFTIGWVRYCVGPGTWLIEEVQSDVQVARTGLKDPETRTKLASAGIDAESFEEAIAALAPYTEAFYHDAIGLVFEMAKAEGVEVEMLEYEAKREFGSPRGIYTDLPREMGMTMREGSRVLPDESDGIDRVWAYRPNPAGGVRRRRRTR